eukprot:623344-Pleurochrysis_carterae.AAC.2
MGTRDLRPCTGGTRALACGRAGAVRACGRGACVRVRAREAAPSESRKTLSPPRSASSSDLMRRACDAASSCASDGVVEARTTEPHDVACGLRVGEGANERGLELWATLACPDESTIHAEAYAGRQLPPDRCRGVTSNEAH